MFVQNCTGEALRSVVYVDQHFSESSHKLGDESNRISLNSNPRISSKEPWIEKSRPSQVYIKSGSHVQPQQNGRSSPGQPQSSGRLSRLETAERLWQEFFSDPSEWWDNRSIKKSPQHPDFIHKHTLKGLRVEGWPSPPWVKAKIASLALDLQQSRDTSKLGENDHICTGDNVRKLCEEGLLKDALRMVELTIRKNNQIPLDGIVVIMRNCGRMGALKEGKQVHALILQCGLGSEMFLGNVLIEMYSKCGSLPDACKVFHTMPKRNVFSWTAIISAHSDHGQAAEAIHLFMQMQEAGISPDKVLFVVLLKACTRTLSLQEGERIHFEILKRGFENDLILGNALVGMYAKCGCIQRAQQIFDEMKERDVVSWSSIMAGYVQNGLSKQTFSLYEQMKQESVLPNSITYVILLKACANITALEYGKDLHSEVIKRGFETDLSIGNVLVDMYAKCGCIEEACRVFNRIREKDLVSWNSMIAGYVRCGCIEEARKLFNKMTDRDVVSWCAMVAGYAQNGRGREALALYDQMKLESIQPDNATYSILLKACASISALEQGMQIHSDIIKNGCDPDMILWNTIVDMYAKSGQIEPARQVFDSMCQRDVVSWNTMIAGYSNQGLGDEAVSLFEQMQRDGTRPNEATYASVLSACSHSGLVEAGYRVFDSMYKDHGVAPTVDHYACMVDLLCRAGLLADAEDLIRKMPIQPDAVIWRTLLSAARMQGKVEIGRRAFKHLTMLEPKSSASYVLLSELYVAESGTGYQTLEEDERMLV